MQKHRRLAVRLGGVITLSIWVGSKTIVLAQNQAVLAQKFVATGKEAKGLHGNVNSVLPDGRILLGGNVTLPTTRQGLEGPFWLACAAADGHVLWSARAPEEQDPDLHFAVASDGDSIWTAGRRGDGILRVGKFDARTLAKVGAVQLRVTSPKKTYGGLNVHSSDPTNFDLQISQTEPQGDSIRVSLFTRDLRLRFDKLYAFEFAKNARIAQALAMSYLIRLPDRSGYYLCLRRQLPAAVNGSGGCCIVKLDNDGEVIWANTYALGSPEVEVEPHETVDGSLLIHIAKTGGSVLVRLNIDGTVRWAASVPGIAVNFPDFGFSSASYRFVRPYLFASGMEIASAKLHSTVFAIDYDTGKIEKEIKFGGDATGGIGFTEVSADSIYVTLLDLMRMERGGSRAALFALDSNLKLRAARTIRDAEPHWPILHTLGPGKFLCSYSYANQKALFVDTVDSNLDSHSACGVLQNATFSITSTYHGSLPITIKPVRLSGVTASDAHGQLQDADLSLLPFELASSACGERLSATALPAVTPFVGAPPNRGAQIRISIFDSSIKVGNTELRTGPAARKTRYISKQAADNVFGAAMDDYAEGRVIVHAWPSLGVQIQEGLRGSSEGKIFKLIAFFENNRRDDKVSGEFKGHVAVNGIDIDPTTSFESIRTALTKKGFKVISSGDTTYARKESSSGNIQIYKSDAVGSDRIKWVEAWCE